MGGSMHPTHSPRTVVCSGLLALVASACATGIGPRAVRTERPDYNQQIVRSADAELLLNLARLRYNDSPLFLELGSAVAQYSYNSSPAVGGQAGEGASGAPAGTARAYSEKPTGTYSPPAGAEF